MTENKTYTLLRILALLLLLCTCAPAHAQIGVPAPQQAQLEAYLADRDIDEAELRRRLAARGIQVDNLTPEEALRLRPQIEAVIAELEAEQAEAARAAKREASRSAEKIEKAVSDGASVEEAITEVTTEAAGETLPESTIYGHQVFRNKSLQVYRATDNASPPESYPLKPGDEIAVTIFGASQTDFILRLDEQGFVELPNTVRMPLAGIPLGEARQLLSNRLKQFYTFRNGQLSIRIQAARTITVNIFGEVETNGSFTMSSLNTGFNALVAAGGPTETGSVRNIQLNQGEKTTTLDVYEYLRNPTQGTALFLNNNSTIYVPLAETVVTLEGGVARPLRYELKAGETLSDLLAFAGGLRPRAERNNIRVTRYVNGQLELLNVDLEKTPAFALRNEDVVEVPIVENPVENFVTIEGAVLLPGRYAFGDGVTVAELLTLGRLRPGARRDAAFLFRTNDDGTNRLIRLDLGADAGAGEVALKRGDRLRILEASTFTDQATFTVEGAVRDSSVTLPFPQDGALTLEEALLLAGGLRPNAAPEVIITRTPANNREEKFYERYNAATQGSVPLQPFDRLTVYEQERFTDRRTVSISGAVRRQAEFTFDPTLTLEDLLYLAGGLRLDADRQRVEIFRLQFVDGAQTQTLLTTVDLDNAGDFRLQAFDEVVVRSTAEFEEIRNVYLAGEVRYPGPYALLKDNERLTDVISRAGGLTAEAFPAGATLYRDDGDIGFVVLDLGEVIDNPANPANMVLLARDTLFIPKQKDLVTIYTANTLANRFGTDSTTLGGKLQVAFQGEKSARWYVNNYAGGFERETASRRGVTVEYASGQVKETSSLLGIGSMPTVKPGAVIRVPAVVKKQKQRRERRPDRFNWIGLVQALGTIGTSIITLVLLNNRNRD